MFTKSWTYVLQSFSAHPIDVDDVVQGVGVRSVLSAILAPRVSSVLSRVLGLLFRGAVHCLGHMLSRGHEAAMSGCCPCALLRLLSSVLTMVIFVLIWT